MVRSGHFCCVVIGAVLAVIGRPLFLVSSMFVMSLFDSNPGDSLKLLLAEFGRARTAPSSKRPIVDSFLLEYNLWLPERLLGVPTLTFDTGGRNVGFWHGVNQTRFPEAKCMDGSPPGFYLRQAPERSPNKSKWFLYVQGGTQCEVTAEFNTSGLKSCRNRLNSSWGSTRFDEPAFDLGYKRVFSTDSAIAPTWHDWNVVLMRYCDGSRWSLALRHAVRVDGQGREDNSASPIYFRGPHNLEAIVKTLVEDHSMHAAEDVIVYGCSAGGAAVINNGNYLRSLIPPSAFLALLPDSGFGPDMSYTPQDSLTWRAKRAVLKRLPKAFVQTPFAREAALQYLLSPNASEWPPAKPPKPLSLYGPMYEHDEKGTDPGCLDTMDNEFGSRRASLLLCQHPGYALGFVQVPLVLLSSIYDPALGIPETAITAMNEAGSLQVHLRRLLGSVTMNDRADSMRLIRFFLKRKEVYSPGAPFGVLLDSCMHHCDWWGNIRYSSGLTNSEEFAVWYAASRQWWLKRGEVVPPKFEQIQEEDWPCRACCLTNWSANAEHAVRVKKLASL